MTEAHPIGNRPYLGFGLGLRTDHYEAVLNERPAVDWFEILSENYLVPGGKPLHYLNRIRERYPLVMHGVSLSIGSSDPLNRDYLKQLKALADRIEPADALAPPYHSLALHRSRHFPHRGPPWPIHACWPKSRACVPRSYPR